jgi:muconate cycloisomerase
MCHDVNSLIAPMLLGLDARELPKALGVVKGRLAMVQDGAHAAIAAVEMALLDIVGKAAGLAVFQLLGGRARESVPVCAPLPFDAPDEVARRAEAAAQQGYRTVKLKVGHAGSADLRVVRAVRAAVGDDLAIKVDANMAYRSAGEAYAALAPLLEFGIQLVEQPLPARDLDELSSLRAKLPVPLLLDESCWDLRDVGEIVRRGAADVLSIYVSEMGGPLQARKGFAAAVAAGLSALLGSQLELGLGTAASWHVGVSVENLAYDSDIVGFTRYAHDIVGSGMRIEEGQLYGPDGPGLGVEVDEEAVAKYAV